MEVKTFSVVRLKDGSEGTIVDVWKSGVAYGSNPMTTRTSMKASLTYAI